MIGCRSLSLDLHFCDKAFARLDAEPSQAGRELLLFIRSVGLEDPHVVKGEHLGDGLGRIRAVLRQALPDFGTRGCEAQPRGTPMLNAT
jgi:hypothetical protein